MTVVESCLVYCDGVGLGCAPVLTNPIRESAADATGFLLADFSLTANSAVDGAPCLLRAFFLAGLGAHRGCLRAG